jgi:hypothetical protein
MVTTRVFSGPFRKRATFNGSVLTPVSREPFFDMQKPTPKTLLKEDAGTKTHDCKMRLNDDLAAGSDIQIGVAYRSHLQADE